MDLESVPEGKSGAADRSLREDSMIKPVKSAVAEAQVVRTLTASKPPLADKSTLGPDMSRGEVNLNISMSYDQLLSVAEQFPQFSLSQLANRKLKQLQTKGVEGIDDGLASFSTSRILDPDEAQSVYFSLPFFGKPPTLQLIYSTNLHPRKLDDLYTKTLKVRLSSARGDSPL